MIPDAVPAGRPVSERRVFSVLQGLPDDCWVYYEPLIGSRYPDFIVLMPDQGLLVIEVKGWHPATVLGGDSTSILLRKERVRNPARPERVQNPVRQAREYMFTLMDRCRQSPLSDLLVHGHGPNQGRFVFPFGHFALLSEITDDQLRLHASGDLRQILPPDRVLAADEFELWRDLSGAALKKRLASFFDPSWPVQLSLTQLDALRAIVHPEIILPPSPNQVAHRQEGRGGKRPSIPPRPFCDPPRLREFR
jgi:hypothetical protein